MRDHADLTPQQRAAVEHAEGPLLILAGPGSGKTRVMTRRIARLIERGVSPRQILAITFTNKAANEMAERVQVLLPHCPVWISTFHRFCARLLRSRAEAVGLAANFTIFDTADQRQLIKQVLSDLDIDGVSYPPQRIAARISRAKNDLQTAEEFVRRFEESVGDHTEAVVARVFPAYQRALLAANAVDFDDLLLHVVKLLWENPEVRRELDERYRYVLVDEYQDTNAAQYRIVRALSVDYPNVCVTGDPDQSIYGWRGAQIDNILRFEADFPNACVIRLEQNFRSTRLILRAADRLIAHNRHRKRKSLVTELEDGEPVRLLCFDDGREEAEGIAADIRRQVAEGERNWSDFAVFYRVNALSRELELGFRLQRVPYRVAAGVEFFERAEVKDLLAYLRLVYNPRDRAAFARVMQRTPRVGKQSLARLTAWADEHAVDAVAAAAQAERIAKLPKPAARALAEFARMMAEFAQAACGPVEPLLRLIDQRTGYSRELRAGGSEQDEQRLANVEELLTAAAQFDREVGSEASLEGFLETTSLVNDVDRLEGPTGAVTLMTLHAAKGLEFPVVYIVGVEHGLIPHERSLRENDSRELEEERRLLFVGMTRARRQLFLTQTAVREFRGSRQSTIPSEFLAETDFVVTDCRTFAGYFEPPAGRAPPQQPHQQDEIPPNPPHPRRLTTAAALLEGSHEAAEVPLGFAVGMSVRHPQYGLGRVVQISGYARRRMVTVEFQQDDRTQTFVASRCPLQPVAVR